MTGCSQCGHGYPPPTENTPVNESGLCEKGCGYCESSGMCAVRRKQFNLMCTPTLTELKSRLASLQESEQNIIRQMENNVIARAKIRDEIDLGNYRV